MKLILLLLKHIIRSRAWIIEGTEAESGEHLSVIYLGKEVQKNYVADLIFNGNCKEKYIEKKFLWPLFLLIKNLSRCSLLIVEGHYHDHKMDAEKGEFFIPLWLQGDVGIPLAARKKSAKDDMRRLKKNRLEYVVTKEPDRFHDFFYNMFLPYVKNRHQERMISIGYDIMMQRAKEGTCELLLIKKDNESIAGVLIVFEEKLPRLWSMGIKDGDLSHFKTGVVAAAYYFSSVYLKERGYEKVNTGSSRAFLKDGVLQYKKKWGVRVSPHDTQGHFLKPLSRSEGLKGFFIRNPFVFIDEGKLSGAVFIENDKLVNGDISEKFRKDYFLPGLDKMIVFQFGDRENWSLSRIPEYKRTK